MEKSQEIIATCDFGELSLPEVESRAIAKFPIPAKKSDSTKTFIAECAQTLAKEGLDSEYRKVAQDALREGADLREGMKELFVLNLPGDICFDDLMDRKNGIEGKMLVANKNGKFVHGAAQRAEAPDAKVDPKALRNVDIKKAALGIANAAVGEAYMEEIRGQLGSINSHLDDITRRLDQEKWAKIRNALRRLLEDYSGPVDELLENDAAKNHLEELITLVGQCWEEQMLELQSIADVAVSRNMSQEEVEALVNRLKEAEDYISVVFEALMIARVKRVQLCPGDQSKEAQKARSIIESRVQEHERLYGAARKTVCRCIGSMKTPPVALPKNNGHAPGWAKMNPVFHVAGEVIAALPAETPLDAGKREASKKKNRLKQRVGTGKGIYHRSLKAQKSLEEMQRVAEAKRLVISEDCVYLLEE